MGISSFLRRGQARAKGGRDRGAEKVVSLSPSLGAEILQFTRSSSLGRKEVFWATRIGRPPLEILPHRSRREPGRLASKADNLREMERHMMRLSPETKNKRATRQSRNSSQPSRSMQQAETRLLIIRQRYKMRVIRQRLLRSARNSLENEIAKDRRSRS
jgi:hypothetical protein